MSALLLELKTGGLGTEAMEYACPTQKVDLEKIQKLFSEWTGPTKVGSIYSGYRQQALEKNGLAASLKAAEELRKKFSTLVVLGIGGSALGSRTAIEALRWTVPHSERRQVLILDNLDPIDFEEKWAQIDLSKTLFAVITKSGGTIETLAQMSVVLERLEKEKLPWREHIICITDPTSGVLRKWVESEGLRSLEVPSSVGGRFSVLTAVGLFPIAFAGIQAEALLEGANEFYRGQVVDPNRMAQLGARLAELEKGSFAGHVLLPYATLLKDFGSWFVQLWGESLGKETKSSGRVGPLPMAAVGATDQHSLLQLLMEGPNRIVNAFIKIKQWPQTSSRVPTLNRLPAEFSASSFAFGKTFGEILNAEAEATQKALAQQGRPIYEVNLESLDAKSLGALFAFYMDLTSYTAAAYDLNPYDQPGVELGKKILPELLKG